MARGQGPWKYTAKDGTISWRIRVDMGLNPKTGRRWQKQGTFRTRRAAEAALRQWLQEAERGYVPGDSKTSLRVVALAWLDTCRARSLRAGTLLHYEILVKKHILPALGGLPISAVHATDIDAFYARLGHGGASPTLIYKCHVRLCQILEYALRRRLVVHNEARLVEAPRYRQPEMKTWSQEEADRFLAATAGTRYAALWMVLLGTGMRRGEALGLRWADLDLDAAEATIVQTYDAVAGKLLKEIPKTDAGRRTMPLAPEIVTALREEHTHQKERRLLCGNAWTDLDLALCSDDGRPAQPVTVRRHFLRLITAARVSPIRVHDLRHTYATLALQHGIDYGSLSKLLGHAKISITMDLYAHVTRGMQRAGALVAGEAIFGRQRSGDLR